MPACSVCSTDHPKENYSKAQLKANATTRKCKDCIAAAAAAAPAPAAAANPEAEAAKDLGNAALKAKDFAGAAVHYTTAISLDGHNHVYYSNRSAAYLSAGETQKAIDDANACTAMKKDWVKGWSRLGAALHTDGQYENAVKAYADGLRVDPSNKSIMEGLVLAQKGVTGTLEAHILEQNGGAAPANVPPAGGITIGTEVEVFGLKGAPQHNGKTGKVASYDGAKERYVVNLETGPLSLKPVNLKAAATAQPEPEDAGTGQVDTVKASRKVIGIDLGTTNSCVGVWVDDEVHILTSPEGRKTVPSFVAFDGDSRLVGDEAKAQQTRNIANTIYDVKRIIGMRMSNHGVQKDIANLQYKVVTGESDKPLIEVEFQGRTKKMSPEEVSAMVLLKMKKIAEDFLGETVSRAVVTVPAYFSDAQRAATQAAGRIAGLTVERIINEPTAAALAYGLDKMADGDDGEIMHVLVFDLGGGTFDVSILKIEGGIFEVLATGGDTRLGGEDFDLAIVEHLLKLILKDSGKKLKDDARAFKRLKVAAQKAKEDLSNANSASIVLDKLWDGEGGNFEYELTKDQFNKLIEPYSKMCNETVKRVLKDAKIAPEGISEVVLVGGSTRIPKVQDDLRKLIGREELCKSVNPDECVAYGAAVQGAILSGERSDRTSALLLVDVTPLSLGVEVQGKAMSTIVKRNTPIPCSKKGMYTTCEDYQQNIDIVVYEGERSHVDGNNQLGEFSIDGIERAKRDIPKVEVCFNIDANGILTVTAEDKVTKVVNRVVIRGSKGRLSEDEVEKMVEDAEKFAEEDKKFTERLEARNELERLAYDMINAAEEYEIEKLERKAKEAQAWCDSVALTAETEDYVNKKLELKKLMKKLGLE